MTARRIRGESRWLVGTTALLIFVIVARVTDLLPFLYGVPVVKVLAGFGLLLLLFDANAARTTFQTSAVARYTFAIAGLATLSVAYSYWRGISLGVVTGSMLAICVLMLLVFKSARHIDTFERYLRALAWAGVALSVGGFVHAEVGRLSFGKTYDPNDLAFVMAAILPIVLAFWRLQRGLKSLLWLGAAAAILWTALLTQSRGGLIGLLLAVSYLAAVGAWRRDFSPRLRVGRVLVGWVLLAVLAVGVYAVLPGDVQERYATLLNPSEDYNMTAQREGRIAIWTRGLGTFVSTPWGVGVGAYPLTEMANTGYWRTAHNSLLEISVELGVLGGVAFVLLYLRAWRVLGHVMERAVPDVPAPRRGRRALARRAIARGGPRAQGFDAAHDPQTAAVPEHWAIHAQHLRATLVGMLGAGFFISQAYALVAFSVLAIVAGLESRYFPRPFTPRLPFGARHRRRAENTDLSPA